MLLRASLLLVLGCGAKTAPIVVELPPCESDAECDDGVFCNGLETCIEERCRRGPVPECADEDVCTEDVCDETLRACVNPPLVVADMDADTYYVLGECGDDCDDTNPDVHPGADEICNGIDDDCDGRIDEGADYMPSSTEGRLSFAPDANGRGGAVWADTTETWGVTYWETAAGSTDIFFRQLAPDGSPLGEPTLITRAPGDAFGADMVWTGEVFGLVWQDRRDGVWEIYFNRLTPDGEKLAADYRVTFAPDWSINPTLVWTGDEFVLAWQDWRHRATAPDNFEVYVTFLDRNGFEIGDDIRLTNDPQNSEGPALAIAGERIGLAYVDGRTGVEQVWFMVLDLAGEIVEAPVRVSTSNTDAYSPELVWAEDAFLLAWQEETLAGDFDIVSARIASEVEGPVTIVSGEPWARAPRMLFNGDSVLLSYSDDRLGSYDVWAALYDTRLMRLGDDIRVTHGDRDSVYGTLSRGGTSVGVLFEDLRDGNWEVYFTRLLCSGP